MRGTTRGYGMLVLFVVTGAILGGILGDVIRAMPIFSGAAAYLTQTYPVIDISPIFVNLYVIEFSFGLAFQPNLISIFGVLLAIFLFKKV